MIRSQAVATLNTFLCLSCWFICLFGVLRRFQHCTGHITTGSWKGRGNQYIEFARVVYCKLPTNGKQLPAFPLKAVTGIEPPTSEVGGESVTTLPPWPPSQLLESYGGEWYPINTQVLLRLDAATYLQEL